MYREFMYLVFPPRMPGESYQRRLTSLMLCESDVFPVLINSLACRSHAEYHRMNPKAIDGISELRSCAKVEVAVLGSHP